MTPAEEDALGAIAEVHSDTLRWLIGDDDPRRPIGYALLYTEDQLRAAVAQERALAEIREVWAGSECGEPVYAQEAYAIRLCKQMYQIACDALSGKAPVAPDEVNRLSVRCESQRLKIDAQEARIKRLEEALRECANELEGEIDGRYKGTLNYPSQLRRYERDMEPVNRAREVLK